MGGGEGVGKTGGLWRRKGARRGGAEMKEGFPQAAARRGGRAADARGERRQLRRGGAPRRRALATKRDPEKPAWACAGHVVAHGTT